MCVCTTDIGLQPLPCARRGGRIRLGCGRGGWGYGEPWGTAVARFRASNFRRQNCINLSSKIPPQSQGLPPQENKNR
eukprot:2825952-Amphidinium_carterae.1